MQALTLEKMPTAITSDKYPIHKWFNFVAGYSPEYVDMVIKEFRCSHGRKPAKIYDPFAGCATTCVVANELGIQSIGVERNPFFYKIGLTKINANSALKEIDSIIHDFAEMTRMQLYFWEEASSWADISEKHRNHMLVNTTTALKHVKSIEVQSNLRNSLPGDLLLDIDPIVGKLSDIRKDTSGKKEYNLLIYPYLAQMQQVLQRCYIGLKNEGEVHIVISDAAFYGIHIDTPEFIKKILSSIGYHKIQIELMRTRGDRWLLEKRKRSDRQLGEFEIIARKDS